MKTSTLLVATLLGLALATAYGQQTQSSTTTTTYVQTSKIVGMKVTDSGGQEVGVVKDVVLDRNTGCMAYTVLSTGGTGTRVAGGTKTVAVPWTVYTATSDPSVMMVRVERDRVYNAPAFDYARIDEYSRSGYINNIYSYYGVAPAVGAGVGVSGTTTTGTYGPQTGAAGQTAATAAPSVAASPAATAAMATASPSAAVSASPSATAKGRPTATPAASRRGHASPSATAEESTGERKTHQHGESTASPGTSSSRESATSDEGTTEHKAGRRHKTTEEETTGETGSSKRSERSKEKSEAEPTATP
jgi:sporulation protein YlmC with PRC-barrel domain